MMIPPQRWKKWIRIIAYILGLGTLGTTPALLLEYGDVFWEEDATQLAVEISEETSSVDEDTIDADAWDEIVRTSDLENEQPTQSSRKHVSEQPHKAIPEGAYRIGCECMDATNQTKTGRGACSGHGGVRYWVYQFPDKGRMRYPTWRHEEHPDSLNINELNQLDSHQPDTPTHPSRYTAPQAEEMEEMPLLKKVDQSEENTERAEEPVVENTNYEYRQTGYLGFFDAIIMLMVCVTVAFITHTLFNKK